MGKAAKGLLKDVVIVLMVVFYLPAGIDFAHLTIKNADRWSEWIETALDQLR